MEKQKGFTLIELLVVISIIGVLSTIAMTSLNGVRKKARDTQRKAELMQIKKALESYYTEHGQYVSEGTVDSSIGTCAAAPCPGTDWDYANTSIIGYVLRDHGFFQNLPKDPVNSTSYYYQYEPDCNQGVCIVPSNRGCCYYTLTARMEGGRDLYFAFGQQLDPDTIAAGPWAAAPLRPDKPVGRSPFFIVKKIKACYFVIVI